MDDNMKKAYPLWGMIIITTLLVFGVFMLYYTGCFQISSLNDLTKYLYYHCFEFIVSLIFIITSIYVWISYAKDAYLTPKKEIVYLKAFEDEKYEFVDKKGKSYFIDNVDKYDVKKYYEVLKTSNIIYEVIDESKKKFTLKKGKNYWTNLYSPVGIFENMLIIPALYVIVILGLIAFFMSVGFYKLFGIIWIFIPVYFIIYDYLYKKKLQDDKLDKKEKKQIANMNKRFFSTVNVLKLVSALIPLIIMILIYNDFNDYLGRVIFAPIVLLGFCVLGYVIAGITHNDHLEKVCEKGYVLVFLIYWFGTLAYFSIKTIIAGESLILLFSTIPFWLAGIAFAYYSIGKDIE